MVFIITLVFEIVSNNGYRSIAGNIGVVAFDLEVTVPEFNIHRFFVGEGCSNNDTFDIFTMSDNRMLGMV